MALNDRPICLLNDEDMYIPIGVRIEGKDNIEIYDSGITIETLPFMDDPFGRPCAIPQKITSQDNLQGVVNEIGFCYSPPSTDDIIVYKFIILGANNARDDKNWELYVADVDIPEKMYTIKFMPGERRTRLVCKPTANIPPYSFCPEELQPIMEFSLSGSHFDKRFFTYNLDTLTLKLHNFQEIVRTK